MAEFLFNFSEFNEKANEIVKPFRDFVIKNHGNPFFWMAAFGLGVAVFFMTYNALHGMGD